MEKSFVEGLIRRNKELEENAKYLETKVLFLSQIARELEAPLDVLFEMIKLSLEQIDNREMLENYLIKMQENARIVSDFRNHFVDNSDIETGMIKLEKTKFDLRLLLEKLSDKYRVSLDKKFLDFYIDLNKIKDNLVVGDKVKIEKILESMLEQAITAASYSGNLCLYVEQIFEGTQDIKIRFTFRYTGRKISADMVEKFQLSDEISMLQQKKEPYYDTIKYATSKYFLDMVGGSLFVETKLEDEIGIIIELPFGCARKTSGVLWDRFSQIHTLFLSDEEEVCEKKNRFLMNQIGKKCDTALIGEKTLERIKMAAEKGNPYRLCVVESAMDDNREMLAFIREIRNIFGNSIFIALITDGTAELKKLAMEAGVDRLLEHEYFAKGFLEILINLEREEDVKKKAISRDKDHVFDFEGKCVLIAEDVSLNMELIVNVLKRVNMTVFCAENGAEAVRVFESKPSGFFDCILMDVTMPEMDGYAATRTIRASGREDAKTVQIYAMTSNAFLEDIELAKESGMNGHIAKPIDTIGLYYTLEKIFYDEEVSFIAKSLKKKQGGRYGKKDMQLYAQKDIQTNTWSRAAFEKKMKDSAKKEPIAFLLASIDHFQAINDTLGPKAGEKILLKVAGLLVDRFGSSDMVIRFGGDEFAVFLPKCGVGKQTKILDTIDKINKELMNPGDDAPFVSLSAGLAFSETGYTNGVYKMADRALYEVRRRGNSGCIVYSESI